jgi:hypothetical protein
MAKGRDVTRSVHEKLAHDVQSAALFIGASMSVLPLKSLCVFAPLREADSVATVGRALLEERESRMLSAHIGVIRGAFH